jgi:hypothetical protein
MVTRRILTLCSAHILAHAKCGLPQGAPNVGCVDDNETLFASASATGITATASPANPVQPMKPNTYSLPFLAQLSANNGVQI